MSDDKSRRKLHSGAKNKETACDVVIEKPAGPKSVVTPSAKAHTQLQEEDEPRATITLEIVEGPLTGKTFTYDGPSSLIIGRSRDCAIRLPSDDEHKTISRHHCLLDLAPPEIRLRDFGSLNGTWVNGVKLGQRESSKATPVASAEISLNHGDQVKLGATVFKVAIQGGKTQSQQQYTTARQFLDEWNASLPKRHAFTIERELGRGGMGVAFLAHDRAQNPFALKVLLPQGMMRRRHRQRFRRELTVMKRLRHENIVSLKDYFVHQGGYILQMEYCDGGSLADLLARQGGKLPLELAFTHQKQLLAALSHAHSEGIVHRDLSPENLLFKKVSGENVLKLADFGLAKACCQAGLSGLTRTGSVGGKPHFMSRKLVIDFKYAEPGADIWSAVAIFYHSLTGATPRDFPQDKDPWSIVLSQQAVPLAKRAPELAAELIKLVDSLLDEKSAQEHSAKEVLTLLETLQLN